MHSQFRVSNFHCRGCVKHITNLVANLHPSSLIVNCSLESKTVTVSHPEDFDPDTISTALARSGYKIFGPVQSKVPASNRFATPLSHFIQRLGGLVFSHFKEGETYLEDCELCHRGDNNQIVTVPQTLKDDTDITSAVTVEKTELADLEGVQATSPSNELFQALFSITGMTCSACVRAITEGLEAKTYVRKANVVLLASSAVVNFEGYDHVEQISDTIQDLGYGAVVEEVKPFSQRQAGKSKLEEQFWKAYFVIDGMIDYSCASIISDTLERESWITKADVAFDDSSVIVEFENRKNVSEIPIIIKSIDERYHSTLIDLIKAGRSGDGPVTRTESVHVNGIPSEETIQKILVALADLHGPVGVDKQLTLKEPILTITYTPNAPHFTIRHILAAIESAEEPLKANIYHPPTPEERARTMHAKERLYVIYRVILSFLAAIPSFIIGIVFMSLVSSKNSIRIYLMRTWANVSRAQWALLIISTPVYFFAADLFHRRAFKELVALWRPGSSTPIIRRFYRFGSMNLLMSLGTSIAYFASIAELIIISQKPASQSNMANYQSFYFDSVVFLTLFLLIGRLIEAWSRAKTADAVASLGRLRPTSAIIYNSTRFDKTQLEAACTTTVDAIESGDIILVPHGASPPCDGILLDDRGTFDESSLTGESRLISKSIGDDVLSGTINQGSPVLIRATKIVGTSMLDQIIQVVREGQARRAPVERIGDTITSYFVPVITLISISTWIIWLVLGETGSLPLSWLDVESGGWPYLSLQFSIAVFIIACPCGFGLAAPTAMFVGGGLAAKNGILAKGGGEAFQEASALDLVVFDKTGTLTEGGKPSVSEWKGVKTSSSLEIDSKLLPSLIRAIEEKSSHPIAAAIVKFLKNEKRISIHSTSVEELPGQGMKGLCISDEYPGKSYMVLVGNERLMSENDVSIDDAIVKTLHSWKMQRKSVVLVAVRISDIDASILGEWALQVIAAVSDPIRRESAAVIAALQSQGIDTWMISGDNETTARAVGQMVGIAPDKIIADVLPQQKAEKIQYLQRSQGKASQQRPSGLRRWRNVRERAIVAMVGDGVNDSPALTVSDVGIAIGSGSDVAISSADFVLLSSDLSAVVDLIQLSRAVFNRIKFNFIWALVYNIIALPIAAGVLYPIRRHDSHVRLDPVWASLAMALSSISVVTSSLALKTKLPYVGFRKTTIDPIKLGR